MAEEAEPHEDREQWAHAGRQITGRQRRMLEIVARAPAGISARAVADAMWPESDSWRHPTTRKRGGVVFGQGAQLKAGSMLAGLKRAGLLRTTTMRLPAPSTRWHISPEGVEFLAAGQLVLDDERLF